MTAVPVVAAYLDAIGAPPDADTWPDSAFYPRHVPPRVYAFLVGHAREQHGRPLPERWRAHKDPRRHRCYATAGGAALRHRALTYTEGIDLAADDPRPVPHAWTTDRHGKVVDLTTLERESYFGIPIPTAIYARCVVHDKIARPVLPVLMDIGWTPGMSERLAAARLARWRRAPATFGA